MCFVPYSVKKLQLQSDLYERLNKKVELHLSNRPILEIADRAKMSALFLLTPTFNAT